MRTTTRRLEAQERVWEDAGTLHFAVRLQGEALGWVEVRVEAGWDGDRYDEGECGDRYTIDSELSADVSCEIEEARWMVASQIREVRNSRLEERAEEEAQEAQEAVEALVSDGRAADVLKALRAAGLI